MSGWRSVRVEGKRRFLRDFWRKRGPTPDTPENEQMVAFYGRIAQANQRFREGRGASIPGWRTDRGRIFLVQGEPDDVRREPARGPSYAWENWKSTKGRELYYLCLDRPRLGTYSLVYTRDRRESSAPE